jgi:hypothetical protein
MNYFSLLGFWGENWPGAGVCVRAFAVCVCMSVRSSAGSVYFDFTREIGARERGGFSSLT